MKTLYDVFKFCYVWYIFVNIYIFCIFFLGFPPLLPLCERVLQIFVHYMWLFNDTYIKTCLVIILFWRISPFLYTFVRYIALSGDAGRRTKLWNHVPLIQSQALDATSTSTSTLDPGSNSTIKSCMGVQNVAISGVTNVEICQLAKRLLVTIKHLIGQNVKVGKS